MSDPRTQPLGSRRPRGVVFVTLVIGGLLAAPASRLPAADLAARLAGRWMIDKDHSEFPADIGFDVQVEATQGSTDSVNGPRSRGRSSGAASGLTIAREGEQTLKILGDVTDEAEHPWPVLTIGAADSVVTMTDGDAETRRFRPGKDDEQRLADGGITTHTKWDKNTLVVDYEVEKDRNVRYTYSRASDTAPLEVGVCFRDHGHGVTVRRMYLPAR